MSAGQTSADVVAVVRSRTRLGQDSVIFATRQEITEARSWADDCQWAEGSLDELTDQQIVRGVDRHYDGGWEGFLADAAGSDPRYVVCEQWTALDIRRRFAVVEAGRLAVDTFRTRSAADDAARLLNAGLATVDQHALIGCRVVVK